MLSLQRLSHEKYFERRVSHATDVVFVCKRVLTTEIMFFLSSLFNKDLMHERDGKTWNVFFFLSRLCSPFCRLSLLASGIMFTWHSLPIMLNAIQSKSSIQSIRLKCLFDQSVSCTDDTQRLFLFKSIPWMQLAKVSSLLFHKSQRKEKGSFSYPAICYKQMLHRLDTSCSMACSMNKKDAFVDDNCDVVGRSLTWRPKKTMNVEMKDHERFFSQRTCSCHAGKMPSKDDSS